MRHLVYVEAREGRIWGLREAALIFVFSGIGGRGPPCVGKCHLDGGRNMKLAVIQLGEANILFGACFIPLEMTVLCFYVNNSQQRGVCKRVKSEHS